MGCAPCEFFFRERRPMFWNAFCFSSRICFAIFWRSRNLEEPAAILTRLLIALSLFLNGCFGFSKVFLLISGLNVHSSKSFSSLMTSAHLDISSRFFCCCLPQVNSRSCTVMECLTSVRAYFFPDFSKLYGAFGSRAPLSII